MPNHPPVPKAPLPTREIFDPFNSSSTGHQTASNRLSGSTSWRDSRSHKLAHQFRDASGHGGDQHRSDLVGAGSVDWRKDGRKDNGDWEKGAPGLREPGWQDIRGLLSGNRKRSSEAIDDKDAPEKRRRIDDRRQKREVADGTIKLTSHVPTAAQDPDQDVNATADKPVGLTPGLPQIFRGLTMFLNGSTAPLVSDHRLKQLFAQHGGNASIALGRRTVTHVILGKTCGGGLASSKIHKEIITVRGKSLKYVTAQWVLDSVEKGIRQPEGQYIPSEIARRIGGFGQGSVGTIFGSKKSKKQVG